MLSARENHFVLFLCVSSIIRVLRYIMNRENCYTA